ncbi:MAG: dephospho-CoA kinase [Candidatus Eisenbacteria bacterium]|nr:dephospho-CoA kinase [Candidatus Eisenbacteria bacterium]
MKVIGVTGRTGCGKSELCAILARHPGCAVLDADRLGHDALRLDPGVRARIVARFGSGILGPGGEIDRARLGDLVFGDRDALDALDAIVHPWIVARLEERVAALRARGDVAMVLIDAALLLDWTARIPLDRIVVVRCDEETSVQRLKRKGLSEPAARRRLASQRPEEEFLRAADEVIENQGDRAELERRAERLWERLNRPDV